jgi:hypothetical protein
MKLESGVANNERICIGDPGSGGFRAHILLSPSLPFRSREKAADSNTSSRAQQQQYQQKLQKQQQQQQQRATAITTKATKAAIMLTAWKHRYHLKEASHLDQVISDVGTGV